MRLFSSRELTFVHRQPIKSNHENFLANIADRLLAYQNFCKSSIDNSDQYKVKKYSAFQAKIAIQKFHSSYFLIA